MSKRYEALLRVTRKWRIEYNMMKSSNARNTWQTCHFVRPEFCSSISTPWQKMWRWTTRGTKIMLNHSGNVRSVETRTRKSIFCGVQGMLTLGKIWIWAQTRIYALISRKSYNKDAKKNRKDILWNLPGLPKLHWSCFFASCSGAEPNWVNVICYGTKPGSLVMFWQLFVSRNSMGRTL